MKDSIIIGLLQNVAILISFTMLYEKFWIEKQESTNIWHKLYIGFFLGAIGILLMYTPWHLTKGIVFDTRSVLISISGLFIGTVPTIVLMIITAVGRLIIGGAGQWMGVAVIVSSGLIGLLWRNFRPNWKNGNYYLEMLAMGFIVHAVMAACTVFLPAESFIPTLKRIAIPLLIIYSPATMLVGLVMLKHYENFQNKLAQKKLRETEQMLFKILESGNIISLILNIDGTIRYCNSYFLNISGYKFSEIVGKNWFEIFVPQHLRDENIHLFNKLVTKHGYVIENQGKIITKYNNEMIISWFNISLLSEKNEITGIASIGVNITESKIYELKIIEQNREYEAINEELSQTIDELNKAKQKTERSEQKLSAILNSIPDLIFHFDREGFFISFLQENKMLYKPIDDFIGKNVQDVMEVKLSTNTKLRIIEALEVGESEMDYDLLINGKVYYYYAKFSKLNENEVIAIIRDITLLKEQEVKLQQSNNAKDRFISILAHDLINSFNSFIGFSDLLYNNLNTYDAKSVEKFIGIINQSAHQSFSLLEEILLWARANSNKFPFEPISFNFIETVEDVLDNFSQSVKNKNITVTVTSQNCKMIFADINMFKTIIRNLFSNAIKYTPNAGRIDIYLQEGELFNVISVSDSGIGMTNEQLERLFDISQKQSTPGLEGQEGTGLGLLICKEFVERHKGKIWAESKLDCGSSFIFTLPNNIT